MGLAVRGVPRGTPLNDEDQHRQRPPIERDFCNI